ncbi:replication initiation protein [Pseudomonas alliivorans]|nr:replication initiation protein [Pseudomonas alliivorans]MEE4963591.1 replication initiation protein [Pseudomonas alliivorans]MEE4973980.1 replication initiation protein [Pseudomonas alliivorans]MEE4978732.1 replication initiation protein [Pseudomonas alliivorans]MEE4984000.1 replication initiation protein [Pseudomonas alliivorans]
MAGTSTSHKSKKPVLIILPPNGGNMDAFSNALTSASVTDSAQSKKQTSKAKAAPSRYFEEGTALNRILTESPYLARCSDNKTAALVRPREHAIRFPYMQINRREMVSWLIFDLDHANSLIWDDLGLPQPNLIVRNRVNGHSHLYYAISPVCTSEKARDKPIQYMKAVYSAFALLLKADPDYNSGPVAKTPGHPWWLTTELHDSVYELADLADYVDTQVSSWSKASRLEDLPESRHVILFEKLRYYAYSVVGQQREEGNFESFCRLLDTYAVNLNNFSRQGSQTGNLPLSSLRATVRSVSRWTWDKYRGTTKGCRGVMALDRSLPLKTRQSLAAQRTHAVRQKATESKIRAACRILQERGEQLRLITVAKEAGVTRQTVANYIHIFSEVTTSPSGTYVSPRSATRAPEHGFPPKDRPIKTWSGSNRCHFGNQRNHYKNVKHAIHQITARSAGPVDLPLEGSQGQDSS